MELLYWRDVDCFTKRPFYFYHIITYNNNKSFGYKIYITTNLSKNNNNKIKNTYTHFKSVLMIFTKSKTK